MSLLEDVFLEDEAGEAQDLEREIEGEEFEEHHRSDEDNEDNNSVRGDDEAEEDKRRVDPKAPKHVKVVKNPRFVLNPARLTGPRGIHVIPEHFKDFKFQGKGHEKQDLDMVLKKLEHWTYRLYPKFRFADCLKKIEDLGKKRPVMVHLQKIRSDQFQPDDTVVQRDSSDDEAPAQAPEEDEFDKLLQQQIDIARAPAPLTNMQQIDIARTPAPLTNMQQIDIARTPAPLTNMQQSDSAGTPARELDVDTPSAVPKTTSSPSLSEEQKDRMIRNRRMAEERRLARLKQNSAQDLNATNRNTSVDLNGTTILGNGDVTSTVLINDDIVPTLNLTGNSEIDIDGKDENCNSPPKTFQLTEHEKRQESCNDNSDINRKSTHKTNVIDSSSEDDCDMVAVNTSITVDIHNNASTKYNKSVANANGDSDIDSCDDDTGLQIVEESVAVDSRSVVDDNDARQEIVETAENQDDIIKRKVDDKNDNIIAKETYPEEVHEEVKLMEIDREGERGREVREEENSEVMDIDFGYDF